MKFNVYIILSVIFYHTSLYAFFGIGDGKVDESQVWTLYRDSRIDPNKRFHVGTYDTDDKEYYNKENCKQSARLRNNEEAIKP